METLNKVFDSIMDDEQLNFSNNELDTAIQEQTKKVLGQITTNSQLLILGMTSLLLFIMVKEKSKNIDVPMFGISNLETRKKFDQIQPTALQMAKAVFDGRDLKNKKRC